MSIGTARVGRIVLAALAIAQANRDHGHMSNSDASIQGRVRTDARLTPFRRRVYLALLEVPRGRVTTYALLAAQAGCKSARAVGGALRANPFAPAVPCHRVIAADLSIGGFCGQTAGREITRKAALLRSEGVPLDAAGRLTDRSRVWRF